AAAAARARSAARSAEALSRSRKGDGALTWLTNSATRTSAPAKPSTRRRASNRRRDVRRSRQRRCQTSGALIRDVDDGRRARRVVDVVLPERRPEIDVDGVHRFRLRGDERDRFESAEPDDAIEQDRLRER